MNNTPEWMTKCMNTPIDYLRFSKEMVNKEPVYIKGYGNDFGPYYIEDYRIYTDYRYRTDKIRYILKDSETGELRSCLESELCTEKDHYDRLKIFRDRSNSCYGLYGTRATSTFIDDGPIFKFDDPFEIDPERAKEIRNFVEKWYEKETNMKAKIKKIIFSGPCTIVLWADGTKTMARVSEGENFDPEKGVAICFMKKILGHTETNKILRKAHKQYEDEMWKVPDKDAFDPEHYASITAKFREAEGGK